LFLTIDAGFCADAKTKTKSHRSQKRMKINPVTDYEDAWTASAESNVYRSGTFENLSLGYSASNGWDYSLSLINTQILGANNQFIGDTFINIAKTFDLTNDFSLVVGSQNGLALVNLHPQLWYDFSFIDNRYNVTPRLLIHGGPYLANAALTGTSRQVGFMTGTEIILIPKSVSLQLDYISGHHSLSVATASILFNITSRCQIYLGVSVPEQNSGNEFAGILGFDLSTKDL
jgi:hypothetical protein